MNQTYGDQYGRIIVRTQRQYPLEVTDLYETTCPVCYITREQRLDKGEKVETAHVAGTCVGLFVKPCAGCH